MCYVLSIGKEVLVSLPFLADGHCISLCELVNDQKNETETVRRADAVN